MLGIGRKEVFLCENDPDWATLYREEAEAIRDLLGEALVSIAHVGSTAIPRAQAKPLIDIAAEASDIDAIMPDALSSLGYEGMGEMGVPGRRYFVKRLPGEVSTFHVHIYEKGDPSYENQTLFRDYLNAHPEDADRYTRVKQELIASTNGDRKAYTTGKSAFIASILKKARAEQDNTDA